MNTTTHLNKCNNKLLSRFALDCQFDLSTRFVTPLEDSSQVQLGVRQALRIEVGESYLTQREYQCVKALLQRRYYSEVATVLGLSTRTVEYYINNIKKKFHLLNKKALIQFFSELS